MQNEFISILKKYDVAMRKFAFFFTREEYEQKRNEIFNNPGGTGIIDIGRFIDINKANQKALKQAIYLNATISTMKERDQPPNLEKQNSDYKEVISLLFNEYSKQIVIMDELTEKQLMDFFEKL